MEDKENWARLATRVISEGLERLKDAPSSGYDRNPWLNLSRWEDLDLDKNAIDWYSFMKNNVFWYHPMYYVTGNVMPEAVFAKYLIQAKKAMDWASVLAACEARYSLDKKSCQSETILKAWNQAQEKMNR
jgi:uroporphyrinogen-III decarboxylase